MWSKIIGTINKITELLTGTFLLVMVVIIFFQILSRIFTGGSFPWTEELARYLMVWLTFLGAAFSFQYGAHIGIELITRKLSNIMAMVAQVIVCLLSSALFALFVVKGIELVVSSANQSSPALSIPMSYVYSIIPISGVLMILNVVDVSMKRVNKLRGEQ